MTNRKLYFVLPFLFLFSCGKESITSTEDQLLYNENHAINELISLNEEVFDIAFSNRHDINEVLNDENSSIHQKLQQLDVLVHKIKANNPNLDIAEILKESSKDRLIEIYDEGGDTAEYTPCTDAFIASSITAAVAYTVAVVASSGTAFPIATGAYVAALATAAYNWCNCMEYNYENFAGC